MKQHYELLIIVSLKLDEAGQKGAIKKISDQITNEGGAITKQNDWGVRKLAYDIKHEKSGYYMMMEFDLETGNLNKMEASLKLSPEVLRYMLVKKKIKTEADMAKEKMIQEKIAQKKVEAIEKEKREVFEESLKQTAVTPEAPKPSRHAAAKISLDDLDKKLDEILKEEI